MPHQFTLRAKFGLSLCLLLGACAVTPGPVRSSQLAWDNSVAAACRTNPGACASLMRNGVATGSGQAVATAGYTVHQALRILDDATKATIGEELKKCADEARLAVLLRYNGHFKGVSPTPDECREKVLDANGKRLSWAMKLGLEMHEVALKCAAERLAQLRPGGFSIEPRYHYDMQTREKRLVSPEQERALEKSGNAGELLGTLKPDVLLHAGDPLRVQATYDFKFPCVNATEPPAWRDYPEGHPYEGLDQGTMYQTAFQAPAHRVVPHIGIFP